MKNRIRNVIMIMMAAIVFSVIQLNTPVIRAATGCPSAPFEGCYCGLWGSVESGGVLTCYYSCVCTAPGGGEPFEIERSVDVYQ